MLACVNNFIGNIVSPTVKDPGNRGDFHKIRPGPGNEHNFYHNSPYRRQNGMPACLTWSGSSMLLTSIRPPIAFNLPVNEFKGLFLYQPWGTANINAPRSVSSSHGLSSTL